MSEIEKYLASSSPLSRLANKKGKPLKDIKNSVDQQLKMMSAKKKNYLEDPCNSSFADLKASSIIYNVPEFSPPQINFQVAQKLKEKINGIKQQIVTKLPAIKSSNYNSNKIDAFVSHRTVIKELQEWLRVKLQNPPVTVEDSIEYKNMIMGVGMKEVIRLIGTRCNQQANMVSQIWELTWGICRQIIIYLSKRAKKCQTILDQEIGFLRKFYDQKLIQNEQTIKRLNRQNQVYKSRADKLSKQLSNMKKKNKGLKINLMQAEDMNCSLKQQFEHILKENLTFHLNIDLNDKGDDQYKKKTDWVRRMYANLICHQKRKNSGFKKFMIKIMKENNYIVDAEDFGDFQLKNDINHYRAEEQMRRSRVQMELQQNFRKITTQTQTEGIQSISIAVCTDRIEKLNCMVETDEVNKDQIGINTIQTNLPVKKSKTVHQNKNINQGKMRTQKSVKRSGEKKKGVEFDKNFLAPEGSQKEILSKNKLNLSNGFRKESIHVQTDINLNDGADQAFSNSVYVTSIVASRKVIDTHLQNPSINSRKIIESRKVNNTSKSFYSGKSKKKITIKQECNQLQTSCQDNHLLSKSNIGSSEQQQKIQKLRRDIIEMEQRYENKLQKNNKLLGQKNGLIANLSMQIKQKDEHLMEVQNQLRQMKEKTNNGQNLCLKIKECQLDGDKQNGIEYMEESRKVYGKIENKVESLSLPTSRKHLLSPNINYDRKNSEHRNEQLNLMEVLNRRRQSKINSITPTNKSSKAQSIAEYLESIQRPKSSVLSQYANIKFQHILHELLHIKIALTDNNKPMFIRQPECNMEMYRQILKQVMENNLQGKQKPMRITVQKTMQIIVKQISKDIQHAIKFNCFPQLKAVFTNFPTILIGRFTRNFGVRKVAQKHLKDFLLSLKGIQNYTQKYAIIWYFIRNSQSSFQNSELLLFYILLTNIFGSMDKVLCQNDVETIKQLAQQHLNSDPQFLKTICIESTSNIHKEGGQQIQLNVLYKKIIMSYHEYCENRIKQMNFIYQSLTWTNKTLSIELFLQFLSVFGADTLWYKNVLKQIVQILQFEKDYQNGLTKPLFIKIVKKCPQFNLAYLHKLVSMYFSLNQSSKLLQETELINIGNSSELSANLMASILNRKKNEKLFSEDQNQFMNKYLQMYVIEEETNKILSTLTFFESRNNSLMLSFKQ